MGIPFMFSRHFSGEDTDGLVPVKSAIFENYKGDCIPEPVSHSQIVGFMASKKKKKLIFDFYSDICKELAEMNF